MKLNNPPKINGEQNECHVGTSCGYLCSVTLLILTDYKVLAFPDAVSQEQGIQ